MGSCEIATKGRCEKFGVFSKKKSDFCEEINIHT